jgi:hypothetical protein
MESDNGRFTIAKVKVGGRVIYELWMLRGERFERVDHFTNADAAKAAAELEDVF